MTAVRSVAVIIAGHVQGVGYRAWLAREAEHAGLDGWARNRRDGRVEAVLAGSSDGVATVIARCWQGPPSARVEAVLVTDAPRPAPGFAVLPTA